jgi:hypothetical protein
MTARRQAKTRSQPGCGPRGLSPHGWGNGPGDTCGWHEHGYEKVLYCVRGLILAGIREGPAAARFASCRVRFAFGISSSGVCLGHWPGGTYEEKFTCYFPRENRQRYGPW